jgi:hypothetical protein
MQQSSVESYGRIELQSEMGCVLTPVLINDFFGFGLGAIDYEVWCQLGFINV